MSKTKKTLFFITVLTFFYGVYYWGIPTFINIEKRIDFVEAQILNKTGFKVKIEDPYIKMGLTPAVWFMAENISVLNNDNSKVIDLKHSAIKVHLLPLIVGKVQIGNLSSDKIDVNLVYTCNGELKLGQYSLPELPESKMTLSKAFFRIGNYHIKLDDQKQNKKILLDGHYLTLDEFKNNKRMKLSTFAQLFVDKKSSDIMADIDIKLPINRITEDQFKVNGRISNLDLADFSDYAKAFPNSQITSLSGKVNVIAETRNNTDNHKNIFSKISIDNLAIMQDEKAKSIYCEDTLEINTDIDTIQNGFNISNMEVLSSGINVKTSGKVTHIQSNNPLVY
ncbi:hypothetical protein IJZ97_01975, partial [bacterium]|nr:hypothetical protein [bacterium]